MSLQIVVACLAARAGGRIEIDMKEVMALGDETFLCIGPEPGSKIVAEIRSKADAEQSPDPL